MTALPKKKHTRGRSGRRRNSPAKRKSLANLTKCSSCGKLKEPHKACPSCGFYRS